MVVYTLKISEFFTADIYFFFMLGEFLKNVIFLLGFFIYSILIKRDKKLFNIWARFKTVPSCKEKILIILFICILGIPNKILLNNQWSIFIKFGLFFFIYLGISFSPLFYFVLLDLALLRFASISFGILYLKTEFFFKFINKYIFPTSKLRILIFRFFF